MFQTNSIISTRTLHVTNLRILTFYNFSYALAAPEIFCF